MVLRLRLTVIDLICPVKWRNKASIQRKFIWMYIGKIAPTTQPRGKGGSRKENGMLGLVK